MIRELGADEIVRDGKEPYRSGAAARHHPQHLQRDQIVVDSIQGLRPDGRFIVMGADAEPLSISWSSCSSNASKSSAASKLALKTLTKPWNYVAPRKSSKSIVESLPVGRSCEGLSTRCRGNYRFRAVLTM